MEKRRLYAVSQKGKFYPHEEKTICSFIYLHNLLERMNDYDIVMVPDTREFFEEDRIEDVVVVMPNGNEVNAKLFIWHNAPLNKEEAGYMHWSPSFNVHGLVIAKGDSKGMIDAKRKFKERRSFV